MRITQVELEGVLVIEPDVFTDPRGLLFESWNQTRYADAGLAAAFIQDNVSVSQHGVLRGLHLQHPVAQGKLVTVVKGEVLDVAVDVRVGSPQFGRWWGITLSSDNLRQVYIPSGFAHGFCVTSDIAIFCYKCTGPYHRPSELGIAWDDPDIGIDWPVANPQLSAKDADNPRLKDVPRERLPRYEA